MDGVARVEITDVGFMGDGNDMNVSTSMTNGKGIHPLVLMRPKN